MGTLDHPVLCQVIVWTRFQWDFA